MMRFLLHWATIAIALWVAVTLLPGITVDSTASLVISALVLGFVNAVIRPVLQLLALPLTFLTLGLFYLVVNGIAFALAAWLVPGLHVGGLLWSILGSLVVSLVSWFIGMFVKRSDS